MSTSVILGRMVDVTLDGDPYSSYLEFDRLEKITNNREKVSTDMPTATQPTAREVRREAKALRIPGWQDMSYEELVEAVNAASNGSTSTSRTAKAKASAGRTTAKKSAATKSNAATTKAVKDKKTAKASAKRPAGVEPAENGNPFRQGTNLWHITEELISGGKRSDMVRRLKRKIELKPRTKSDAEFDLDAELDRRVLIVGQLLKNDHGFTVEREGRGEDSTIVATAP